MSDIGTISNLAGANPVLARAAPGARSEPPAPTTIQNAVAQPLTTPQAAVTQSPAAGSAEWQRHADPDNQRHDASSTSARQQLADTLDHVNQRLREYNTNLQFAMDDQYQEMVVRIVDRKTQEVVRQIPSEKALAFAKFFEEMEDQQQHQTGSASSKDSKRLQAEGWLLQATA